MVSLVVFAYDNDTKDGGNKDFDLVGNAAISLALVADDTVGLLSVEDLFYQFSMDYRTRCATDYYGPNCSTLCVPRDDWTGHYECDSQGNIKCLPGYAGVNVNCTSGRLPGSHARHMTACYSLCVLRFLYP